MCIVASVLGAMAAAMSAGPPTDAAPAGAGTAAAKEEAAGKSCSRSMKEGRAKRQAPVDCADSCVPALDPRSTVFPACAAAKVFEIRGGNVAESGMPARQLPQMNSVSTL